MMAALKLLVINEYNLFSRVLLKQNSLLALEFFQEFFRGTKSVVMQSSIVMLIFLLFSEKIRKR